MPSNKIVADEIERILKNIDRDNTPYIASRLGHITNTFQAQKKVDYVKYILELAKAEIKGCTVLDAGCGPGNACLVLGMLGAQKVYGVDILAERIEEVQRFIDELEDDLPVSLSCRDIMNTGFDGNSFDYVLSCEAISHYMNPIEFLKKMVRY